MQHNHEKKSHGFEKVVEDSSENPEVIVALTPEAAMRIKFFDDTVNSAVKSGQITESAAKLAKFLAKASGRTATIH